jgi:mannose-6-phosphate isomerase-like protein (cupin superfamily)
MRKTAVGIFLFLMACSVRAQAPTAATDITAAQIQAFLKDGPHDRTSDRAIRVVDIGGYQTGVFGVFRPKNSPVSANLHQTKVGEVYYILEGAGVLVTGGSMHKPTTARPSTARRG